MKRKPSCILAPPISLSPSLQNLNSMAVYLRSSPRLFLQTSAPACSSLRFHFSSSSPDSDLQSSRQPPQRQAFSFNRGTIEPKGGRATKIGIVIRSFDDKPLERSNWGIPPNTSKIGLPKTRSLYTVLRSPHIDKKSREQFEMAIKKQYLVIKAQRHELRNKFFWLKRQRIVGAQYEVQFSCKTRLDLSKLHSVLHQQEVSQGGD